MSRRRVITITSKYYDENLNTFIYIYRFSSKEHHVVVNGLNTNSSDALIREAEYRMYLLPDLKQEKLLQDLLSSRYNLAQICGFPTYAHR